MEDTTVHIDPSMRDLSLLTDRPDDPWKHRSAQMKCRTCMYYVPKEGPGPEIGRCRRNAPTMKGYPAVFPDDWCGEHKLDENKLLCEG